MSTHNTHYPTDRKKSFCSSFPVPAQSIYYPSIVTRRVFEFFDSSNSSFRVTVHELDGSYFYSRSAFGKILTSISFVSLSNCLSSLRRDARFFGWIDKKSLLPK